MKFGKTYKLEGIDYSLPESIFLCELKSSAKFNFYFGAPAWAVKEWKGKLYSDKANQANFLEEYAHHFNAIELNTTFYRMPGKETLDKWFSQVGPDFIFCPKVPNYLSHGSTMTSATKVREFFTTLLDFNNHLGCTFLQLHEDFKLKRRKELEFFFDFVPQNIQFAIEVRHESWFTEKHDFWNFLASKNISAILTDVMGRRDVLHPYITSDTVFIRFVANNLHKTDFERLKLWADKIIELKEKNIKNLYFFIHQPDEIMVPESIAFLTEELSRRGLLVNFKLNKLPEEEQLGLI